MAAKNIKDVEASILQKLKNYSESRREDRNLTLSNYAIERFLYRLSLTEYASQFVLKGAQLFRIWQEAPYRPTRDLDLLRHGNPDLTELKRIASEICQVETEVPDGIRFLPETIKADIIREDNVYDGVRIKVEYRIGKTGQFMQIDIGFGDAIVPDSVIADFPCILNMPTIHVRSYPPETVIAEKVEAMVTLGLKNSRMKDYFDVFTLSQTFEFDGRRLSEAIQATFNRRATNIPQSTPLALTHEFASNPAKVTQWNGFLKKQNLETHLYDLRNIVKQIEVFVMPVFNAIKSGNSFQSRWTANRNWENTVA